MMNTLKSTLLDHIKYGKVVNGCWKFFDVSNAEPSPVGICYKTKELLLTDMYRYLTESWDY